MATSTYCLFRSWKNSVIWGKRLGIETVNKKPDTIKIQRSKSLKCHFVCYQCFSLLYIAVQGPDICLEDFPLLTFNLSFLKPGKSQSKGTTIRGVKLLSFLYKLPSFLICSELGLYFTLSLMVSYSFSHLW